MNVNLSRRVVYSQKILSRPTLFKKIKFMI
ncbi:hypothetical protein AYI70_g10736, partial [Smittium culicis]